jgi:hypothetical protein
VGLEAVVLGQVIGEGVWEVRVWSSHWYKKASDIFLD